jgi:hypothetical protein
VSWTYQQSTGELLHDDAHVATGYSGHGDDKDDPDKESIGDEGPIPRGSWTIGPAFFHPSAGPVVMRLEPCDGTETFGRSGFLMHGDSVSHPGDASRGCVVMPRYARMQVSESHDTELIVIR